METLRWIYDTLGLIPGETERKPSDRNQASWRMPRSSGWPKYGRQATSGGSLKHN